MTRLPHCAEAPDIFQFHGAFCCLAASISKYAFSFDILPSDHCKSNFIDNLLKFHFRVLSFQVQNIVDYLFLPRVTSKTNYKSAVKSAFASENLSKKVE